MVARKSTTEPAANGGAKKSHASQRRYTDEQKIAGVVAMRTYGGIGTPEGLQAARKAVGDEVAASSLYAWAIEFNDRVNALMQTEPPLSDKAIGTGVRNVIVSDMQEALAAIAHEIKNPNRIKNEPKLQSLVLPMAILIDKLQKIAGITPDLEQSIRSFSYECEMIHRNPIDMLNDYTDILRQDRMNNHPSIVNR
jgi:hypothetical protein